MATDESKDQLHDAFDEAHGRLFVGCRNPASVVVLDSNTGREVATFPIGGEIDCVFYDGTHQRIFATGTEGTLDVVEQVDADHYRVLARLLTAPLARTCLFVPEFDTLFVAVPQQKDHDCRAACLPGAPLKPLREVREFRECLNLKTYRFYKYAR
jgi:hypothetical protein